MTRSDAGLEALEYPRVHQAARSVSTWHHRSKRRALPGTRFELDPVQAAFQTSGR